MNDHYYSANPTSEHDFRRIKVCALGETLFFDTDAGLFSRDGLDTGTRTLLEALPEMRGRVLDLGCGWGAVGIILKKKWQNLDIIMTDINLRAAETVRGNLVLNGLQAAVVSGDGFENVEGFFDWILTNPPIRTGKENIYRLFAEAKEHLNPGGHLVLVIRKQQGAPSALKYLRTLYASAEIIARNAGFWVIDCLR